MQESPIYSPHSPPLGIDMSTPLHTPSLFSSSTSNLSDPTIFDVLAVPAAASSKQIEMSTFGSLIRRVTRSMTQQKKVK